MLQTISVLERRIVGVLRGLDVSNMADLTKKQLNETLSILRTMQLEAYMGQIDDTLKVYDELGDMQTKFEVRSFKTLDSSVPITPLSNGQAFKRALIEPMSVTGGLMDPFMRDWARSDTKLVNGVVRRAWNEGKTVQQTVIEIKGTISRKFKDGTMSQVKRHAEAIVRTSTQHVAQASRFATWEANKDIIIGYRWLSTLDSKTSSICQSLDGREYELGKGPQPPIHINCRSTTVAILSEEFDFLKQGETRSSASGPVSANQTYFQWLKTQPRGVQRIAIGRDRAKLLRDGGLSAKRFGELQLGKNFAPLTLEEMKRLEPEMFERAKVELN